MAFPGTLKRVVLLVASLALFLSLPAAAASAQAGNSGLVYVMTNQAAGNSIVQLLRSPDGSLTRAREVSTGGLGSGGTLDPLVSQDSLVLSNGGRFLLAVNAGSDEISVLGAGKKGLTLLDKAPSGGDFPNSIALFEDLVYVINAHGSPNVTGFRLGHDGSLEAI